MEWIVYLFRRETGNSNREIIALTIGATLMFILCVKGRIL